MRRVPQEVKSPSCVRPCADITAPQATAPASSPPGLQLPIQTFSLITDASRPLPRGSEAAARCCERWHLALCERKTEGRKEGRAENVCGVMLMSLQLHDCPLWPSVAPPAIDQGRVRLAASQPRSPPWDGGVMNLSALPPPR